LAPLGRTAVSLPPAWLRGGSLFLTALAGWSGSLALTDHVPALQPGVQLAGALAVLGMLAPRWLHEARRARARQREELRRVRTLLATDRLPVLSLSDRAGLRDTLALPILPTADLPPPIYEAEIGAPGCLEVGLGALGIQGKPPGDDRRGGAIPHAHEDHPVRVMSGCSKELERPAVDQFDECALAAPCCIAQTGPRPTASAAT
jgi:hypothetical protein